MEPADAEERLAALRARHAELAAGDPARAQCAIALVILQLQIADGLREPPDIGGMLRLLDEADRDAAGNEVFGRHIAAMRGLLGLLAAARGDGRGLPEARRLITDNRHVVEPGSALDRALDLALAAAEHLPAAVGMPTMTGAGEVAAARRALGLAATGYAAARAADRESLRAAADRLSAVGSPAGTMIGQLVTACHLTLSMLLGLDARSAGRQRSILLAMSALARGALAIALADEDASRAAAADAGTALRDLPGSDAEAQDLRVQLAGTYLMRIEAFRAFDDAGAAIAILDTVLPYLDRSRPTWSQAKTMLAEAVRVRDATGSAGPPPDRPSSPDTDDLDALQAYAWRVLLAPDTVAAATEARGAAADARSIVSRCLAAGDAGRAVRALDASRGLVLLATTAARDIPRALAEAGLDRLADEWTRHDLPSDLRKRSIEALMASGAPAGGVTRLLDPPSPAEISAALGHAKADALVYLAPLHDDNRPVAVVVPAVGPPEMLRLSVRAAKFSALDAYLASALSGREAATRDHRDFTPTGAPGPSATATLEALADWAWHAAMREVTAWCSRRGLTAPRLVLVPMAEFGLVPWHAARYPDGRYLIRDVTVSYAVSARLFCENARRPAMAATGPSLIVGNPDGTLRSAGEEAEAIHATWYQQATYLGPTGTPEAVTGWLGAHLGSACGVVHLACHGGVATTGQDSAFLNLAGGARLTAESLIDLARRQPDGYRIGVVVLAACSTGLSGRAYDEAFSLVSAFGVSGARSVVGSLWKVPDGITSVLMYVFHHFLQHARLGPAEALRQAQLWMLDGGRQPVPGMPAAMSRRAARVDHASIAGWAGFTHAGQW